MLRCELHVDLGQQDPDASTTYDSLLSTSLRRMSVSGMFLPVMRLDGSKDASAVASKVPSLEEEKAYGRPSVRIQNHPRTCTIVRRPERRHRDRAAEGDSESVAASRTTSA